MSNVSEHKTSLTDWIQTRTEQLLKQRSWHVNELTLVILDELRPLVQKGVSDYTQPLLSTGHLRLDRHMRLIPND